MHSLLSSASPRSHRGRKRGDGARERETSSTCLRSTAHDRSSSHLVVAAHLPLPHESDFSFFSPPPPPSPPPSPPPPNLKILSHRPPAATAILAFAVLLAPLSPKDPRVVPSGSTPVGPVPSFEIRGSLPAVVLFQQQRVSVMLLLLCSHVLYFVPLVLIPFASSLFK